MSSFQLEFIQPPQPATLRNFTTHLSYDRGSNAVAYPCGKSAFIRFLDDSKAVIQFSGHGSSNVSVVKFSPIQGSQYLCSGDDAGRVIVWGWSRDRDTGSFETAVKAEFQVLAGPITDVSWDFEGKRLCVVGEGRDKFGVFISWDSGNSLGEVSGHSQRINACHFKQSRPMRCVTVGDDGSVVFYQGPPFKFAASDRTHHDQGKFVRDVQFSPGSGDFAVTVGSDRRIVCLDGKTGEFIKYIEDENEEIKGGFFAISWIDESRFVTASADATVRLWSVKDSKFLGKWFIPGDALANQQVGVVATKNEQIISLSLDGTLNFLKIGEESPVKFLRGHNKGITALTVNPLISGSYDGRIVNWATSPETMREDHSNLVVAIDNSEPPKYASVSWDDTLKVLSETKYKFEGQPKVSSSANNGGIIAVATDSDYLLIMNSYTGEVLQKKQLSEPASAIDIRGGLVAVGLERTNTIEVFKTSDLAVNYKLPAALRATPSCVSISATGSYLAAGDVMGKIILYDLKTKDIKTTRWAYHTSRINSIAWMPAKSEGDDEDLVATASLDTNIFIYSVKRPMKTIKCLNAHKDGVNVALWENSQTLVSCGADACIKRWNISVE
ncbi:hypothetical protein HG536_0A04010 [Torulaspora globosa]|uniref:Anaphase-promoting complex subunit 4 WD40 domain-containing protein n=1 Tax=Torulaspora globosa TaxID=48254 RepID=A0A7G3ZAP7_9SACH|nr:uncharacterized protein HG536_0A04010 [Torulaspora globosa]QLL30583.1 hypothetical protein HG536_0A04010 [Torulaspora globosa]